MRHCAKKVVRKYLLAQPLHPPAKQHCRKPYLAPIIPGRQRQSRLAEPRRFWKKFFSKILIDVLKNTYAKTSPEAFPLSAMIVMNTG